MGNLKHPIRERRFAVVDMGNNAEISNVLAIYHIGNNTVKNSKKQE